MQTLLLGFFSPRFLAGCHHQTAHRKYAQVEKKILQQGFQSGGLISSSCAGHSLNLSSQGGKSSNFYVSTVASRAVGTYPVSVLDAANLSMPQTQLLVFIANSWACPASLWAPHKLWNPAHPFASHLTNISPSSQTIFAFVVFVLYPGGVLGVHPQMLLFFLKCNGCSWPHHPHHLLCSP